MIQFKNNNLKTFLNKRMSASGKHIPQLLQLTIERLFIALVSFFVIGRKSL